MQKETALSRRQRGLVKFIIFLMAICYVVVLLGFYAPFFFKV